MARAVERLSAVFVSRHKEPGYHLDGAGLYLQISDSGTKSWIFRYTLNGKTREMGLGSVTVISLAKARELATEQRQLLLQGLDPIAVRDAAKRARQAAQAKQITFEACATQYIASHKDGWTNPKHVAQWENTLRDYAYPVIGQLPVSEITTGLVVKVLDPIWRTKNETASRLRGRIENILDWASVLEYRTGDNPARWRGRLDHLLPAPSDVQDDTHFPALPYAQIHDFMVELRQQEGVAALALELLILTAMRTEAVCGAKWGEFDLTHDKEWVVPAARMKGKKAKDHRIPLSPRAVEILKQLHEAKEGEFVFPGRVKGSFLSKQAMLMLVRRMNERRREAGLPPWIDPKLNRDIVPHGFRSTFRDWAAECTNYPGEVAEYALAHKLPDKVEAAYQRGDMLFKRMRLMDDWAAFCDREYKPGEVIPIRGQAA